MPHILKHKTDGRMFVSKFRMDQVKPFGKHFVYVREATASESAAYDKAQSRPDRQTVYVNS